MVGPYLSAVVGALLAALSNGCSPPEGGYVPMTTVEKVHNHDIVLYGTVTETYPSDVAPSVYNADMTVKCVIKTNVNISATVLLTEVGAVPGLCHSSNLTIGLDYIVFLRSRDNGNLVVDDSQLDGTSDNLAEVAKACGLEPRAVQGTCPDPASAEDCVEVSSAHGVHLSILSTLLAMLAALWF